MQCGLREFPERRTRRVLRQQRMASNSNADQDRRGAVLSASASAMTCEPILRSVTRAPRGDARAGARRVAIPHPRARRTRPLRSSGRPARAASRGAPSDEPGHASGATDATVAESTRATS